MVHCKSPANCTDIETAVTIEVLPDIVGIGILTSSLITAGSAFFTVILSYFNDLLPGDYLTPADWGFLQGHHFRKCCRARYQGLAFGRSAPCKHANPEVDTMRTSGMNAFVLSLSDQQLVIGPAMVVAAMTQYCRLSCYEFQVVTSLAFLASTTHLSTLLLLREYFKANKKVRNMRVVAMVANLGLLFYTTIITSASYRADNSVKVQCVGASISTLDVISTIITITFLMGSYVYGISQLYRNRHHRPFLKWLQYYCCVMKNGPKLSDEDFQRWYTKKVWHSRHRPGSFEQRDKLWETALRPKNQESELPMPVLQSNIRILNLYKAVLFDLLQSFLIKIFVLVISAAYSIAQVVSSRSNAPSIEGSENTVDFGQVVPIFLLLLPVLSALEMYFEIHNDQSQSQQEYKNTSGSRTSIQSGPLLNDRRTSTNSATHSTTNQISTSLVPPQTSTVVARNLTHSIPQHLPFDTSSVLASERLYPYSRPNVARALYFSVYLCFAFFAYTGLALILPGANVIVAISIGGAAVMVGSIRYGGFFLEVLKEARVLRNGDLIEPVGGTRAAPPSLLADKENEDDIAAGEMTVSRNSERGEDEIH